MLDSIIKYSFYLLFIVTPLIWLKHSSELFEINKMLFVYLMTIVICFTWAIKMINTKKINIKKTPLDIPILLFLLANILSTIFSLDTHISLFGYYSRLNGGLLSIISMTLLYFALVANFGSDQVVKFLKSALWGGLTVAVYAIPEHFGVSPSCFILHQQLNDSCWVQDVQARVFATLGQPNWLAAYLGMLIFPAIYFLLAAKKNLERGIWYLVLIVYYLAFTFTYARGATIGLLVGMMVFIPLLVRKPQLRKIMVIIVITFISINLLFGSALTNFRLIKQSAPPIREPITQAAALTPSGTQLETGGTESGKIRLIVWKGALDIFKHYPILGSGVETFAYAYYKFRPVEHNLVSEWDFLYNKAHNEYLNYLANTGIVGFGAYSMMIITFIIFIINPLKPRTNNLLLYSLLASYINYLTQNLFGFSVVIIVLFFYMFPAIAYVATGATTPVNLKNISFIKNKLATVLIYVIVVFIWVLLFVSTIFYWLGDFFYNKGSSENELGRAGTAYEFLSWALLLNRNEPLYQSELGHASAGVAVVLNEEDATASAEFTQDAMDLTEKVLIQHPHNTSFHRTAIRTYYLLSSIDEKFVDKALHVLEKTIKLAPTDPKLTYNKAVILGAQGRVDEAIAALEKTVELKPNYPDAHYALGLFYFQTGDRQKAINQMKTVLKIIPSYAEAVQKLKSWQSP